MSSEIKTRVSPRPLLLSFFFYRTIKIWHTVKNTNYFLSATSKKFTVFTPYLLILIFIILVTNIRKNWTVINNSTFNLNVKNNLIFEETDSRAIQNKLYINRFHIILKQIIINSAHYFFWIVLFLFLSFRK